MLSKRFFLILLTCVTASFSYAQSYQESPSVKPKIDFYPSRTVLLYPQGQKAGKGIVENNVQITKGPKEDNGLRGPEQCTGGGSRRNVGDDARMDFYFPKNPNGQLVIITPGGGYIHLSTFNEGVYGAKWLTDRGITACVLKYRLPNGHKTVPLDDVHNAMRYCRYHAKEWGIKQIGVMGGSAGGHLSACAATMWDSEITRPDFAVMYYPRLILKRGELCQTKENLLGPDSLYDNRLDEHKKLLEYYSPENHINNQTPPIFIALSVDDKSVPPTNFIPFYTRLIDCGISNEIHVYPKGGHGWGFSTMAIAGKDKLGAYRNEFCTSLERWLKERLDSIK